MEILWLAIVFYSVGLAVVLHFRPALMFHENGTWKEFGYQRDSRHTIFPFWLFSVAWAFASYVIASAIVWTLQAKSAIPMMSASAAYSMMPPSRMYSSEEDMGATYNYEDEEEMENEANSWGEEEETPVTRVIEIPKRPRGRPRKDRSFTIPANSEIPSQLPTQPRSGYYVIDPASESEGLRRYVYYGATPPKESAM
jgi:hypothetical protein